MSILDEIKKRHKDLCFELAEFAKIKLGLVVLFDYDARKALKTDVIEKGARRVQGKCFLKDHDVQVLLNALQEACDTASKCDIDDLVTKHWNRTRLTEEEQKLLDKRRFEEREEQVAEAKKTGDVPGQQKLFGKQKDDGSTAEAASDVTVSKVGEEGKSGKSGKGNKGKETTGTPDLSTQSTTSAKSPQEIINAGKPQTAMEKAFNKAEAEKLAASAGGEEKASATSASADAGSVLPSVSEPGKSSTSSTQATGGSQSATSAHVAGAEAATDSPSPSAKGTSSKPTTATNPKAPPKPEKKENVVPLSSASTPKGAKK